MNKLTAKEILEIIEKNYSESSFAYDEWSELSEDSELELTEEEEALSYPERKEVILQKLGLGEVEEVDQYGGSGKGDTWYSVKHFKDHDVYIRIDGYYSSYNGTDFEEGYGREVRPKEKVITVFN